MSMFDNDCRDNRSGKETYEQGYVPLMRMHYLIVRTNTEIDYIHYITPGHRNYITPTMVFCRN